MAFSADAIGFYLQVEDQLTPTLGDATVSYRKFVRDLEKLNRAAYKSASTGIGSLSDLVHAFESLPSSAVSGYQEALSKLRSRVKAITQPINIAFTPKSKKDISNAIGQAISRALSGVKIRLSAGLPQKPLGMFDTTNLRGKYGNMTHPPDMKGKIEPKKFKKGGLVEGGTPGKDSVLSLLEPGEFVLPKNLVKEIGQLRGAAGEFISAKSYAESIARIENLGKGMEKLKVAIEAGFDDGRTMAMFERGLRDMTDEIDQLVNSSSSLSYQTQVRLAPAIKDVRMRMSQLETAAEEAGKTTNNLLAKILGPARFLAISSALTHVVDGMSKLKDGGVQAFDALGGDQIESFTTNVNQMNTRLNLSREGLRAFKLEAADVADLSGLNINEMSEAMEGMVEAGVRDLDMLKNLAPATTSFAKSSRVSFDTAGMAAYKLADAYGFTETQVAGTFDNIRMFQQNSAANAEKLTSDMLETMQALGPALLKESTQDQQAILSNFARLGASLADNWAGDTGQLQGLLGRAMGGEVEAMQSVSLVFGKTQDELRESFKSGNLTGLLDGLAGQIQQLTASGNTAGLEALRQSMGFEGTAGEFGLLGANIGKVNTKLDQLGSMQHVVDGMANAQANLTNAADANRTMFERLQTEFGQLSAKEIPGLGISFGQVIDWGKELNLTMLLSIGYLGQLGAKAAFATGKFLAMQALRIPGVAKLAGGVAGKSKDLLGMGRAAGGAAGSATKLAGGAAGGAGMFKGMAEGVRGFADSIKEIAKGINGTLQELAKGVSGTLQTLAGGIGSALGALGRGLGAALSGVLTGLSTGLSALSVGVATLGAVLLSPPGIAFTVSLIAAVLALGAALRLAAPAIQVFGDVAIVAIGKAVEGFGMLIPVFLKIVDVAGTVLLGAIDGIVTIFKTLFTADITSLLSVGPALFTVAAGLGAVAIASASLAAVQFGQGILSFISGGPADASGGVFGLLASMIGSIRNLKVATPEAVASLTATVNGLSGFALSYARLMGTLGDMPSDTDIGARMQKLAGALTQVTQATNLQQARTTNAIAPSQIQTLVDAVLNNPAMDSVAAAAEKTNALLSQILQVLASGKQTAGATAPPQRVQSASQLPSASALTRDVAAFGH